jgi:hypothetical protein
VRSLLALTFRNENWSLQEYISEPFTYKGKHFKSGWRHSVETDYIVDVFPDTSVGFVTTLQAGTPRKYVAMPWLVRMFPNSLKYPDRLWNPNILLCKGIRGSFHKGKAGQQLSSITKVKNAYTYTYTSTPLDNKKLYCIFKTCCIVHILLSTKCRSFHSFNPLQSNNTHVFQNLCAKIWMHTPVAQGPRNPEVHYHVQCSPSLKTSRLSGEPWFNSHPQNFFKLSTKFAKSSVKTICLNVSLPPKPLRNLDYFLFCMKTPF